MEAQEQKVEWRKKAVRVSYVFRRGYMAHPRSHGKDYSRTLSADNEQSLISSTLALVSPRGVRVSSCTALSLESMSMAEQVCGFFFFGFFSCEY